MPCRYRRHAGRAIEDCSALNKRGDKAALFAGWRAMNDYRRENKLEAVATQLGLALWSGARCAAVLIGQSRA